MTISTIERDAGYTLLWTRDDGSQTEAEHTWDTPEDAQAAFDNRDVLWVWAPYPQCGEMNDYGRN